MEKYNKRLEKLADYLDTVPKKNFDMGVVACDNKCSNLNKAIVRVKKRECGTAACAMGSMPVVWPKEFKYEDYDSDDSKNIVSLSIVDKDENVDFDAARKFFNLNSDVAYDLFTKDSNSQGNNPKYVAKKLRNFVKLRRLAEETRKLSQNFPELDNYNIEEFCDNLTD